MGNDANCKCLCNSGRGASFSFDNGTPGIIKVNSKDLKNRESFLASQKESTRNSIANMPKSENSMQSPKSNCVTEADYLKEKYVNKTSKKFKTKLRSSNTKKNTFDVKKSYITKIQSLIRGHLYRKKYNKKIKNELKDFENALIKEINDSYNNSNLKLAERSFGAFDKDNWKLFYKDGDLLFQNKNEQENYNKNFSELFGDNNMFNFENAVFHAPFEKKYGKTYFSKIKINPFLYKTVYKGYETLEGERQGYGTLIQDNGTKIEGYWNNGILDGWGRITDSEGTILEGYFINGKINGKGIKKTLDGLVYIGEFFQGIREGTGNEETKYTLYEGQFHKDLKHGKGKLLFKELKEKYEGEFESDSINGYGTYTWNNGNTYQGTFVKGKMDGIGLFLWNDGSKYYGEYKNNIKEGKGKFTWPNGKSFEGTFKNGKQHGKGILKTTDKKCKKDNFIEVEFCEGKLLTNYN